MYLLFYFKLFLRQWNIIVVLFTAGCLCALIRTSHRWHLIDSGTPSYIASVSPCVYSSMFYFPNSLYEPAGLCKHRQGMTRNVRPITRHGSGLHKIWINVGHVNPIHNLSLNHSVSLQRSHPRRPDSVCPTVRVTYSRSPLIREWGGVMAGLRAHTDTSVVASGLTERCQRPCLSSYLRPASL